MQPADLYRTGRVPESGHNGKGTLTSDRACPDWRLRRCPAARETQDRIRTFVRNHPTVYCGTHTPQGYENLEARRVMDLDNPVPTVLAQVDFSEQQASGKYVCSVCGYVYDPEEHHGVAFEDLPDDWRCPRCRQPKEEFNKA